MEEVGRRSLTSAHRRASRAIAAATIAAVSARKMVSPSEAAIHPDSRNHCSSSSVHPPSGPTAKTAAPEQACKASRKFLSSSYSASTTRLAVAPASGRPAGEMPVLPRSLSFTGAAISGGAAHRDCSAACSAIRCQRWWRFCAAEARCVSVRRAMTGMMRATPISVHFSIAHSMRSNLKMARTRVTWGAGRTACSLPRVNSTRSPEIEVIFPRRTESPVATSNVLPDLSAQNASQMQSMLADQDSGVSVYFVGNPAATGHGVRLWAFGSRNFAVG